MGVSHDVPRFQYRAKRKGDNALKRARDGKSKFLQYNRLRYEILERSVRICRVFLAACFIGDLELTFPFRRAEPSNFRGRMGRLGYKALLV